MMKIHFLSSQYEIFLNLIFSYIKATAISSGYMAVPYEKEFHEGRHSHVNFKNN